VNLVDTTHCTCSVVSLLVFNRLTVMGELGTQLVRRSVMILSHRPKDCGGKNKNSQRNLKKNKPMDYDSEVSSK
jgi:hypothetical protein